MRQQELIEAFLNGATDGTVKSLSVDGDQLVHYNTAIAERYDDKVILNYTRYSLATGRVQKMITDTVDADTLVYVSGVPSDTRKTLVDFLHPSDTSVDVVPDEYLMRIEHSKFGEGYVLSIDDGKMRCRFGRQEKVLIYDLVVGSGLVRIIEDRR